MTNLETVEQVQAFFLYHNPKDFGYEECDLDRGYGRCIGDGLVEYNLYFDGVQVGTVKYDNGTSGWSTKGWEEWECYCFHTHKKDTVPKAVYDSEGEIIYFIDEQYMDENPNASAMHYAQLEEEREEFIERENAKTSEEKEEELRLLSSVRKRNRR